MITTERLRAALAIAATRLFGDPTTCRCGHPAGAHEHWRAGSDCSTCQCPRFRRARHAKPVDLAEVCRDEQVVNAVLAGDLDHALLIAPPEFVGLLAALADTRRRA